MAEGERSGVPLKRRCSRTWDAPAWSRSSSREPVPTQKPMHTDRASSIRSVARDRPDGRTSVPDHGRTVVDTIGGTRRRGAALETATRRTDTLNGAGDHLGRPRHRHRVGPTARPRPGPDRRTPGPTPPGRPPRTRPPRQVRLWTPAPL